MRFLVLLTWALCPAPNGAARTSKRRLTKRPSYMLVLEESDGSSNESRWINIRAAFAHTVWLHANRGTDCRADGDEGCRHDGDGQKHIALTVMDRSYAPAFSNWLCGVRRTTSFVPAVLALDRETHAFFQDRGVASLHYSPPQSNLMALKDTTAGTKNRAAFQDDLVMWAKVDGPFMLLRQGLAVLFSEADVFWIKDPLVLLDSTADVMCSVHQKLNLELNYGFFFARPSVPTLKLFEGFVRWLASPSFEPCHDQKLFNYLVRGDERAKSFITDPVWGCPLVGRATFDALRNSTGPQTGLRHVPVPFARVPHPSSRQSAWYRERPSSLVDGTAVAVHIWSGAGQWNATQRVDLAKKWGVLCKAPDVIKSRDRSSFKT